MIADLLTLPTWIASVLGVSVEIGQIIACMIVYLVFLVPIFILSRRIDFSVFSIFGFFTTIMLISIGWLPFFGVILFSLFMAYKVGGILKEWFT
jgi:hypothetical protein